MATVLINISKYVIIFAMLIYTYLCFSLSVTKNETSQKVKFAFQNVLMYVVFCISYAIIIYNEQTASTIVFFILEFIYLILLILLYDVLYPNSSRLLVNNMALLMSFGFIMVERLAPKNAFKQFTIILVGTIVAFFFPAFIKRRRFHYKAKYFYAVFGIILLLITLLLGKTSYGANLSISFGGASVQPSEFVKLMYVMFIAAMLSKARNFKNIVISAIFAAAHVLVLVASTDLGAALIFFIVYVMMLFIASGKLRYLIIGMCSGGIASVLAYKTFAHVRTRISAWRDPWSIANGKGYQITQSLFAIGTGGWFGMGLYQGLPTKIPVVVKDFVFSAIAEEMGMIVAICIILICISCYINMMKIATKSRDMYYKLIAVGVASLYIFQCFLTIGGVTKFIPSTGVTLPFVSYGGSSILSSIIMFAMVQAVFILVKENENDDEEIRETGAETTQKEKQSE